MLSSLALSSATQAELIEGVISFDGQPTLDSPLGTATKVVSWNGVVADDPITGAFATKVTKNDSVSFTNGWSFNSGEVTKFWEVQGFTFTLTSSSLLFQDADGLVVAGSGVVSGYTYDPTPGLWSFLTEPGVTPKFRFSTSAGVKGASPNGASVPDGGTTVTLLGLSLLGLYGARRKFGSR
jgi:hypothetical protein